MQEKDSIALLVPDRARCEECKLALGCLFDCRVAGTDAEVHALLSRQSISAIVVWEQAGTQNGFPLCHAIHQTHPEVRIILICDAADQAHLIDAFNAGCLFRGLVEPVATEVLVRAVRDAVRRFEMDRIQSLLIERAEEIDRQIATPSARLYRFRASVVALAHLLVGSVGLCIVAGIVLLLAGIGVFLLLYYIKSAFGIDIFGDRHLKDFLSP